MRAYTRRGAERPPQQWLPLLGVVSWDAMKTRRGRGAAAVLVGAVGLVSGGCGEDLFVMSQMHQITTSEEAPAGSMCGALDSGESGSETGDASSDFWMSEKTTRKGARVRIGSEEETLEDLYYDRDFLESREVDRFIVTTHGGDSYSFMYWGGDECEQCPPIEFEGLPGDPWGCGTTGTRRD